VYDEYQEEEDEEFYFADEYLRGPLAKRHVVSSKNGSSSISSSSNGAGVGVGVRKRQHSYKHTTVPEQPIVHDGCIQQLNQVSLATTQAMERILRNEREPVLVSFTVMGLSNIDPANQRFDCNFKIFFRWYDPALANDADMISLQERNCFANGTHFDRTRLPVGAGTRLFPRYVVKTLAKEEESIVAGAMPCVQFVNACTISPNESSRVIYLDPHDPLGFARYEQQYVLVYIILARRILQPLLAVYVGCVACWCNNSVLSYVTACVCLF
jgi:hypothetical protein